MRVCPLTTLPQKELLRPDEVMKYLDICKSTLYYWVKFKKIKSYRAGKKLRFRREDVIEFTKRSSIK